MVPYDVLVDPLSLPRHPVIAARETIVDVLYDGKKPGDNIKDTTKRQVTDSQLPSFSVNIAAFIY